MSDDIPWHLFDDITNSELSPLKCSECEVTIVIEDGSSGYRVCQGCGEVLEQIYDRSPEWSQFDEGKGCGAMRCGAPTNPILSNCALGTTVIAHHSNKIKRLTNWDHLNYDERSRKEVLDMIDSICKKNNIIQIVADSAKSNFYKLCQVKHTDGKNEGKKIIFRGKNRLSIIAACVYYGAHKYQPRNLKEIAQIFKLDVKQVSKGNRRFLELMKDDDLIKNVQTSYPTSFIHNFCVRKLPKEYMNIAIELAENVTKLDLASNHQPNSIAAACILLLVRHCNLGISKKDIIQEFKISEPTLNKTIERLEKWKTVLFNSDISSKISQIVDTTILDEDINTKLAELNISMTTKPVKPKRKKIVDA